MRISAGPSVSTPATKGLLSYAQRSRIHWPRATIRHLVRGIQTRDMHAGVSLCSHALGSEDEKLAERTIEKMRTKKEAIWRGEKGMKQERGDQRKRERVLIEAGGENGEGETWLLEQRKPQPGTVLQRQKDSGVGLRRTIAVETNTRIPQSLVSPSLILFVAYLHDAPSAMASVGGRQRRKRSARERLSKDRDIVDFLQNLFSSHDISSRRELQRDLAAVASGNRDVTVDLGAGHSVRIERHREFTTFLLTGPLEDDTGDSVDRCASRGPGDVLASALNVLPEGFLARFPGRVFLAAEVEVRGYKGNLSESQLTDRELSDLSNSFYAQRNHPRAAMYRDLVGASLGGGAKLFANYNLDQFGVMHALVQVPFDTGLYPRAARSVQDFLQAETYRLLCLMRLPVGRALEKRVDELSDRYVVASRFLTNRVKSGMPARIGENQDEETLQSDRAFLNEILLLNSDAEEVATRTQVLAQSSDAYNEIMCQRLNEADFDPLHGFAEIAPFMAKRVSPAVKTCRANATRTDILVAAVERTTANYRTVVESNVEQINDRIATVGIIFAAANIAISLFTFLASIQG